MALSPEVIDLIRLKAIQQPDQTCCVREIRKVQEQPRFAFMPVGKDAVDAGGIETARPPLDAMHHVTFFQQKFRQVGAILTSNASNQCCLSHGTFTPCKSKTAVLRAARSYCPTVRTPGPKVACPNWRTTPKRNTYNQYHTAQTHRARYRSRSRIGNASWSTDPGRARLPFLLPLSLRLAIRKMIL
jgi:hypothetical protein